MRHLLSIVLASASPRRYDLLTSLGLDVRVVVSDVAEGDRPGYSPCEVAALHAGAKAAAVAQREADGVIVAADTVVELDGKSFGKPRDAAEAGAMLRALSNREHVVHTAYVVLDVAGGGRIAKTSSTRVRFANLDDATIAAYVAGGEPFDKAGAYGIQGRGAALVERIDGDFYTVMGFPLGDFVRSLPQIGFELARERAALGAA